jgi:hypothetical protein
MPPSADPLRSRLDRFAIWLSAACLAHCVATTVFVAALSTAGGLLGSPLIHEAGLVLAIIVGAIAFGRGVVTHRRRLPLVLGAVGLALMGAALVVPHGRGHVAETLLTIAGVAILAAGHMLNRGARD